MKREMRAVWKFVAIWLIAIAATERTTWWISVPLNCLAMAILILNEKKVGK